jgi:ATP-dependent DNA helicase RecG
MIDTMGYGIHQMYADQKKRYLPLHDYDLTEQSVRMTIYGHVVDEAYSSLLVKRPDLSLEDVCLLDRIQKHLGVTVAAVAHLRREGLIKGRMPHPHISAVVAEATGQQAEYMRKKELSGSRYRAMLIDYIGKFNGLTRKQINDYMIPEIRGELSIEEKIAKISNLMTYLRRLGEITNMGSATKPLWKLSDKR